MAWSTTGSATSGTGSRRGWRSSAARSAGHRWSSSRRTPPHGSSSATSAGRRSTRSGAPGTGWRSTSRPSGGSDAPGAPSVVIPFEGNPYLTLGPRSIGRGNAAPRCRAPLRRAAVGSCLRPGRNARPLAPRLWSDAGGGDPARREVRGRPRPSQRAGADPPHRRDGAPGTRELGPSRRGPLPFRGGVPEGDRRDRGRGAAADRRAPGRGRAADDTRRPRLPARRAHAELGILRPSRAAADGTSHLLPVPPVPQFARTGEAVARGAQAPAHGDGGPRRTLALRRRPPDRCGVRDPRRGSVLRRAARPFGTESGPDDDRPLPRRGRISGREGPPRAWPPPGSSLRPTGHPRRVTGRQRYQAYA